MKGISLITYSFQSFYLAGAFLLFFILLPSFYNLSLGIALSSIGIVILISRVTDIFTDFFIGYLTEKRGINNKNKKNQFIFGVFLFLLSITGLFVIQPKSIFYFILFYNIGLLGFTIAIIPYDAILLDQKKVLRTRLKIASYKEGFALLGVIFALLIPAFISHILNIPFLNHYVIRITGLFFIGSAVIGLFLFYFFYTEEKSFLTSKINFKILLQNINDNKKIITLVNITFFNLLANNFTANLFIIFVSSYLNLSEYVGVLLALYFITTLISIPIWYIFGKKYSNLFLLQVGLIISISGFLMITALGEGDLFMFTFIILITGLGVGVDLIIPQAELADILDHNKKNNRLSQSFTTLFSIIKKLAIGLAAGVALTGYGYLTENNINIFIHIPNILIFYFIIPIILKFIVLVLVFRYRNRLHDPSAT